MEAVFACIGIFSISVIIIAIILKMNGFYSIKQLENTFQPDEKVYKAARLFAQGASNDEVKEILLKCFDFDDEDADEIINLSEINKSKEDGGYSSFLKSVNKILGKKVYCIKC